MKYLKVFTNFSEDLELLSDVEVGRLFRAMLAYAEAGTSGELKGNERFLWATVKKNIDNQREKYEERCSINKAIATNRYESLRLVTKKHDSCEEKDKDKEKEKDKEKKKIDKRKNQSFVPPSLQDVEAYCRERNSPVDPKRFFDYFEAGGWVDSKGNPVRNWKQKLLTWEAHGGKENVHGTSESSAKASAGQAWNLTGTYL